MVKEKVYPLNHGLGGVSGQHSISLISVVKTATHLSFA
jgi:hypothetical protein